MSKDEMGYFLSRTAMMLHQTLSEYIRSVHRIGLHLWESSSDIRFVCSVVHELHPLQPILTEFISRHFVNFQIVERALVEKERRHRLACTVISAYTLQPKLPSKSRCGLETAQKWRRLDDHILEAILLQILPLPLPQYMGLRNA